MNLRKNMMHLGLAAGILLAGALPASCGSTGPKRIEATTSSMRDTKLMLERGAEQVAAVMAAARSIEAAPDRARAFEGFVKELDRLESEAKRAQSAWASLTSRTEAYVVAWEAESAGLSTERSKQVAASRREAFAVRVAALQSDLAEVKSRYVDFTTKLSDVRILLANDLTQDGVAAVRPFLADAGKSADALRASIASLASALEAEMGRSATSMPRPAGN